jgi:hypothetical protein
MSFTISYLKTRLNSKLHNSIGKVKDVNSLICEAGSNLLLYIDTPSTIRKSSTTNVLYDQVYSIPAPVDLKEDKIISIIPQNNPNPSDNYNQTFPKHFDLYKEQENGNFSVSDDSGLKTIAISTIGLPSGATINDSNTVSDNGTWAASGDASGLSVDTYNFLSGNASLRFDLAAAGSAGILTNSTMRSVDISEFIAGGAFFIPVYIADPTAVTSIDLAIGSSAINNYSGNTTVTADNTTFITGWNILKFVIAGMTVNGTPVTTATNYAKATINYDGTAVSDMRIDNIVVRRGYLATVSYYSKYLFKTSAGVWIESPTAVDDSDVVNLELTGFNMLLAELAYLASQEIGAQDATFDVDFFSRERDRIWGKNRMNNKSQASKRSQAYYKPYIRRYR